MIEAYEIGIRLALDDGISAGVQAIRRELADLNRVVDASAAKLAGLRDAAGLVVAPSVAGPRRGGEAPLEREEPPQQEPAGAAIGSSEPGDAQLPAAPGRPPTNRQAPATEPGSETPARAPAAPRPIAPPDAPAEPQAARAAYWTGSASPAEPSAPMIDVGFPEDAAASAAPAAGTGVPAEPAFATSDRQIAAPQIIPEPASPERRPPAAPERQRAAAPTQAADATNGPPATRRSAASSRAEPAPVAAAAPAAPSRPAAPAAPPARIRERRPGAAAVPPVRSAPGETAGPEQTAAERPRPAAQAADDPDQRTMEVHIYLEGAPLGRWMTDHLGRAASRPSASVTGFDPRVGPAWPGAPIG